MMLLCFPILSGLGRREKERERGKKYLSYSQAIETVMSLHCCFVGFRANKFSHIAVSSDLKARLKLFVKDHFVRACVVAARPIVLHTQRPSSQNPTFEEVPKCTDRLRSSDFEAQNLTKKSALRSSQNSPHPRTQTARREKSELTSHLPTPTSSPSLTLTPPTVST